MLELFDNYQLQVEQVLPYGFVEQADSFLYRCPLMDQTFELELRIKEEQITFKVWDLETGEEYIQVKQPQMTGQFVGQVRKACQAVFLDIRKHCFRQKNFLYEQSERLIQHVAEKYQAQLEYLWAKSKRKSSSQAGVLRHEGTKKWYGLFMTTDWSKFKSQEQGKIEVLNVKSDQVAELLEKKGIYPAFHMNKKYWLSLPLDDSLSDQEIYELLATSFQLTKKK
ncbi:MmcQ/YjbR family DNA-binding protein [Streptococcus oricebi]|uniref:MmcQ family protein n=1 Tax=Streptococcus oricebi TaxID=1547447 RepID=A0ABS5B2E3_9STRE|nr:MmcQ/YjbR family DNA-binding protein [Streptococcus oricebi]MBP2622993.1 MmcQ family protein [Streptococcus oricebi]